MEIQNKLLKRIHVNQHIIKSNQKLGQDNPVLTVKVGGRNFRAKHVDINGPSVVKYMPEKPLSCGARVWIETRADLTLHE